MVNGHLRKVLYKLTMESVVVRNNKLVQMKAANLVLFGGTWRPTQIIDPKEGPSFKQGNPVSKLLSR
jgi:hypothetical protein